MHNDRHINDVAIFKCRCLHRYGNTWSYRTNTHIHIGAILKV